MYEHTRVSLCVWGCAHVGMHIWESAYLGKHMCKCSHVCVCRPAPASSCVCMCPCVCATCTFPPACREQPCALSHVHVLSAETEESSHFVIGAVLYRTLGLILPPPR